MTYPILTLDRLQSILNKSGIDDHAIIAGVQLTKAGYQKLAVKMGVNLTEINQMMNELISNLRSNNVTEDYSITEEDHERYTIESDFLGNVTIRDAETGDENYIQGSVAGELLSALDHPHVDKQTILQHYMETAITESDDGVPTYDDEIDSRVSTYNFPWKIDVKHGTATAEYSLKGNKPNIKIVSVRDAGGDEIVLPPHKEQALTQQAIAFIGDA